MSGHPPVANPNRGGQKRPAKIGAESIWPIKELGMIILTIIVNSSVCFFQVNTMPQKVKKNCLNYIRVIRVIRVTLG